MFIKRLLRLISTTSFVGKYTNFVVGKMALEVFKLPSLCPACL